MSCKFSFKHASSVRHSNAWKKPNRLRKCNQCFSSTNAADAMWDINLWVKKHWKKLISIISFSSPKTEPILTFFWPMYRIQRKKCPHYSGLIKITWELKPSLWKFLWVETLKMFPQGGLSETSKKNRKKQRSTNPPVISTLLINTKIPSHGLENQ